MEVKFKIRGMEATVTVRDEKEATRLLSSVLAMSSEQETATEQSSGRAETPLPIPSKDPEDPYDLQLIKQVVVDLKGSKASRVLAFLARNEKGCTDAAIRQGVEMSAEDNFGPIFSSISKRCKRHGLEKEAVYRQRKKRDKSGQFIYFYRLTDEAAEFINSIPDYDKQEDFPDHDFEF